MDAHACWFNFYELEGPCSPRSEGSRVNWERRSSKSRVFFADFLGFQMVGAYLFMTHLLIF